MKIPNSIESLILKCAKHNAIAIEAQKSLEDWLQHQGVDIENDTFRDMLIDSVEISHNPQVFIDCLRSDNVKFYD